MVIALNSIAAPKMYFIHYETTFFLLERISKYLLSALLCGWKRKWQPTSVFLPGESHEQRNLVGYSPWSCKESDMTEGLMATSVSFPPNCEVGAFILFIPKLGNTVVQLHRHLILCPR